MSIKTWKKEFYSPITRNSCKKMSERECIKHSLKKWSGLTKKNLKKHDVVSNRSCMGNVIQDSFLNKFIVDDSTCALCHKHFRSCGNCPISIHDIECDCDNSGYVVYLEEGNPQRMIRVLKKCLKEVDGI